MDVRRTSNSGRRRRSEMMLEWASEQPTEITTTAIDLEFLPTDESGTRSSQSGVCAAAGARSTLGSHEL